MQINDPNNAPTPLVYDLGYLWLLEILDTDPRRHDESTFWMIAYALNRYGAWLSDQFAFRNEERYAFYVQQTKQKFGKQGCRLFPFRNCSRQKGYDSEGYGPQKRIYSSRRYQSVVLYQYWFGPRHKSQNEGYSLIVILPSPRAVSRRRKNLLSAEIPPADTSIESEEAQLDFTELFPELSV